MRLALSTLLTLLLLAHPLSVAGPQQEARGLDLAAPDQVFDKLQAAAIQHEAIALLIEQEKLQGVLPELKKIFDLALPHEYEIYQVQEVQSIVQKLRDRKEVALAHPVVDLALGYLQEDRSKSALYLLKAQLYRDNGQLREAAEATELARKLYRGGARGTRSQ